MKPGLSLRLSQHLALTPQLQQSIRLLQLSTVELNQELEQALAENPLLERDDDPLALAVRVKPDGSIAGNEAPAPSPGADPRRRRRIAGRPAKRARPRIEAGNDMALDWGARGEGRNEDDDSPREWAGTTTNAEGSPARPVVLHQGLAA